MPLVRADADDARISAPEQVETELRTALARTSPRAPVVVLIHGYKFSPAIARSNPHNHILSLDPDCDCWKALSWPRALGLCSGDPDEPLCIALGWEARGSFWQAYEQAARTGQALAELIRLVRRLRPGPSVDVLAHSLGCRVTLAALPHLQARDMGRAVLMAPAEMRSRAVACLDTIAGRRAEFWNITSRENGPYDRLLEWLVAPLRPGDRAVGTGMQQHFENWADLNIDRPEARAVLAAQGFPIAASDRRICHWSVYLRPGLFPLYRAVLHRRVPLAALRPVAAADTPDARNWNGFRRLGLLSPFAS